MEACTEGSQVEKQLMVSSVVTYLPYAFDEYEERAPNPSSTD
jgi:hypothetical protein